MVEKKMIAAVGGVILAFAIIVSAFFFISSALIKKFEISDYYTIIIKGTSGDAGIEVEKFNKNYNKKEKPEYLSFVETGDIKFFPSKSTGIKNGDSIDITVSYDKEVAKKLKIKVANTKFKIKVEGLKE